MGRSGRSSVAKHQNNLFSFLIFAISLFLIVFKPSRTNAKSLGALLEGVFMPIF
jgi:hypothetical protein